MKHMEIYRTSDRGLAAYLLMRGFVCVGAVPSPDAAPVDGMRGKFDFIFIDVDDAGKIERAYYGRVPEKMSAFSFITKWYTTGRILKDPITRERMEQIKGGKA